MQGKQGKADYKYFRLLVVLHKILETTNFENQDCSRHPRLKVDFF